MEKRYLVPQEVNENVLAGYCRAAREFGDLSFNDALETQRMGDKQPSFTCEVLGSLKTRGIKR